MVKLDNKTYDILKWVAQLLLPAMGTLYFALAGIWNLPYGEQVLGTITAIDTFLGVILGLSQTNYQGEGTLTVDISNPKKDVYSLNMDIPIEECMNKKYLTLKVDNKE